MHNRHVIRLNEILHQELPVRIDFSQIDPTNRLQGIEIKILKLFLKGFDILFKIWSITTNIDKNPVMPDLKTHWKQSEIAFFKSWNLLNSEPSKMRGRFQVAISIIRPGMVRAGNGLLHFRFLCDQGKPSVAAKVMENMNFTLLITQQKNRLTT